MSEQERDAVIDECIRAVLTLRGSAEVEEDEETRDSCHSTIGAACWRLTVLKSTHRQFADTSSDQ